MVAIKNFKLPKSCMICPFSLHERINEWQYYCMLTQRHLGSVRNGNAKWLSERRSFCPLVEMDEVIENE